MFLQFNEREVLDNPGKVSHKVADSFALSEFEKYRVIQDKLFESDFDKFMIEMKNEKINNWKLIFLKEKDDWIINLIMSQKKGIIK